MLTFICLFFPAVLSVRILEALSGNDFSPKQLVYNYFTHALLINFACLGAKAIVLGTGSMPLCEGGWDMLPSAAFIYLVMALCSGVLLALLQVFLCKHVAFVVEEVRDAF